MIVCDDVSGGVCPKMPMLSPERIRYELQLKNKVVIRLIIFALKSCPIRLKSDNREIHYSNIIFLTGQWFITSIAASTPVTPSVQPIALIAQAATALPNLPIASRSQP